MFFPRKRLRPTRLPHPILDAHAEAFYAGIAIGFVLAVSLAVIFFTGGSHGR